MGIFVVAVARCHIPLVIRVEIQRMEGCQCRCSRSYTVHTGSQFAYFIGYIFDILRGSDAGNGISAAVITSEVQGIPVKCCGRRITILQSGNGRCRSVVVRQGGGACTVQGIGRRTAGYYRVLGTDGIRRRIPGFRGSYVYIVSRFYRRLFNSQTACIDGQVISDLLAVFHFIRNLYCPVRRFHLGSADSVFFPAVGIGAFRYGCVISCFHGGMFLFRRFCLGFHFLQLCHIDGIGIFRSGCNSGNLTGDVFGRIAYGNSCFCGLPCGRRICG